MKALLTATAAILAFAGFGAVPLQAEPSIKFDLYFNSGEKSCPNVATCELQFESIPMFASLQVERVACTITLSNEAKIGELALRRRKGAILGYQQLASIQELPVHGSTTRYIVNAAALLSVKATERPAIYLALRGGPVPTMTMNCTVHGAYSAI